MHSSPCSLRSALLSTLLLALLAPGCAPSSVDDDDVVGDDDDDSVGDDDDDTGDDDDDDTAGDDDDDDDSQGSGWRVGSAPCGGSRAEALYPDTDGSLWLACGGKSPGIWRADHADAPFTLLPELAWFHGYDITRGPDGLIYLAGLDEGGSEVVYALGHPSDVPETMLRYSGSAPFMRIGPAQHIALTSDGRMMADDLAGGTLAFFDGWDWHEAEGWESGSLPGTGGYQMLALKAHGPHFYAAGSTISQPPTVFLPSADPAAEEHHFDAIALSADQGELFGLHVFDDDSFAVAGVDRRRDRGIVYRCTGDCTNPDAWTPSTLTALGIDGVTELRDIHFDPSGRYGVAVGREVSDGIVITSADFGATWQVEEVEVGPLSACVSLGGGRYAVAGGYGAFAVL